MFQMDIIDHERKKEIYPVKNLSIHIEEFVEIQEKTTTKYNYQYVLNNFNIHLQDKKKRELRKDNVESILKGYKSHLLNKGNLSSNSIDNYLLRVQSFLNYLNLTIKIKKLNSGKSKGYKYLTIEEIKQLLKTIPEVTNRTESITKNKALICTMFTGGLRVTETINLKKHDFIKEKNNYYLLVHGKGRATDEVDKIALPDSSVKVIKKYLKKKEIKGHKSEYLFTSFTDKKLTRQAVGKIIKKIAIKSDELNNTNISSRATTHSLRHSLARYLLVNKGIPINQVKDILRHSNIETTAKYLTTSEDELTKIRKKIRF